MIETPSLNIYATSKEIDFITWQQGYYIILLVRSMMFYKFVIWFRAMSEEFIIGIFGGLWLKYLLGFNHIQFFTANTISTLLLRPLIHNNFDFCALFIPYFVTTPKYCFSSGWSDNISNISDRNRSNGNICHSMQTTKEVKWFHTKIILL